MAYPIVTIPVTLSDQVQGCAPGEGL